jgi:hypothetical protein
MNDMAIISDKIPAHLKDTFEGIGRGNENVGNNIIIPQVVQIHPMSKVVAEGDGDWRPGDFRNIVTGERFEKGFTCLNITVLCYWTVKPSFGAQVSDYRAYHFETEAQAHEHLASNEDANKDNYEIFENHAHMVLMKDAKTGKLAEQPVMFHLNKSKAKISKLWNTNLRNIGGDRFATVWDVKSVVVASKATGGSGYQNIQIDKAGWATKEDYESAIAIYEQYANTPFDK